METSWESLLEEEKERRIKENRSLMEQSLGSRKRRITEGCLRADMPIRDIPKGMALMKTDRGIKMILAEGSYNVPSGDGPTLDERPDSPSTDFPPTVASRQLSGLAGPLIGKAPKMTTPKSEKELREFEEFRDNSPFIKAIKEDIAEEGLEEEAALIESIQDKILPSSVRTPEELREGILSGRISSKVHRIYDKHAEIRRRIFMGHSSASIARDLNMSASAVGAIKNSPIIQEQLRQLHIHSEASAMRVHKEIQKMAPKALETLEGIMMDDDAGHAVRLKAAIDVLDRAGHKPVTKTEASIKSMSMTLGAEDIAALKRRAVEAAKEAGTILEADIVEVVSGE